ncbi:hypothetical protein N9J65_03135 [Flavobacteriaceae bacterium]|jgi:hypothetical protein|nr:hypothetical protein [Flavobacteriaceae bacterium]
MKQSTFLILFLFFSASIWAQSIPNHALGLRFGDNGGVGPELSYQQAISEATRYQVDLGWRSNRRNDANQQLFKLSAAYQWVKLLDGEFQYYYGGGTGFLYQNVSDGDSGDEAFSSANLLFSGIIGVEYTGIKVFFDTPIHLGLDIRPEYGLGGYYDSLTFDVALALRFGF